MNIDQPVRLVSIDTPESKLGGHPASAQATLDRCRQRLLDGTYDAIDQPVPPPGDPRRRTFNLQLIETGWAVFFPIYPSLLRDADLNRAVHAAELAWRQRLGAWAEFGENLLLGYEYRTCLKLGAPDPGPGEPPVTPRDRIDAAFRRICIDVRTREVLGLFGYHTIEPPYRLWCWATDLEEARKTLQLLNGGLSP